jgi:hypothetical protein
MGRFSSPQKFYGGCVEEKISILDYKDGKLIIKIDFWGAIAKVEIPIPEIILTKIRQPI